MSDITNSEVLAEQYFDKYRESVDLLEKHSPVVQAGGSISSYDVAALGQELDQWENYKVSVQESGKLGDLGQLPSVATDIITVSSVKSILPLIASTQPIAEEHNVVYYKQVKAGSGLEGYAEGDVLRDPFTLDAASPDGGRAGLQQFSTVIATTDGTTKEFTGNLVNLPVRPFKVEVMAGSVGFGKDTGDGKLMGFGLEGELDYTTGVVTVKFTDTPAAGVDVTIVYSVDVDAADSIPSIQVGLLTKEVKADIWALRANIGTFSSTSFEKRFGQTQVDEVANDLIDEITRAKNIKAVTTLYDNAVGVTEWEKAAKPEVSDFEHRRSFSFAISEAENVIHANSGATSASRIIVGKDVASIFASLPGFTRNQTADTTNSVSVYGSYNGVTIIRASGVVPDNEAILIANPNNYFIAPLVYAPYMPLMVTSTIPNHQNPFQSTKGAGVWAGMTSINGGLATKLKMI